MTIETDAYLISASLANFASGILVIPITSAFQDLYKFDSANVEKAKSMIKNLIENFENHIESKDPVTNCLDVAIITAPEKRTQKTKDKLKTIAGRVLNK